MGSGGQNKLTEAQAIQDFIKTHGEGTYGYDDLGYVNNTTPVNIFCNIHQKHFTQIPKNHKKGGECPDCIKERVSKLHSKGKDKFIEEAIEMYGDIDIYDEVNYINNKTKVTITCSIHGKYTRLPETYLQGFRCSGCRERTTTSGYSKYSNKEMFKEAGISIYGDVTDYSKVGDINKNTKVELRCKKHDHEYTISVTGHLGGQKCPKCAMENYSLIRTKTTERFIEESIEVYNDLHDYSDTVYEGCRKQVEIRCKKHDHVFKTLPNNYLKGFDCPICRAESSRYSGKHHHTREGYVYLAKGRTTYLYLIKCSNNKETFYKIGKTFRSMDKRYTKTNMPYDYEVITIHEGEAGFIFDLEESMHKKYKKHKHTTDIVFPGYSECYKLSLPIEKIINL